VSENKTSRLPEIGEFVRNYGTLVRVEDVTPQQAVVMDYVFESISARLEARVNGKLIKQYSEINDFYGLATCVDLARQEAAEQLKWFGESDLEFVVVKITKQARMRPHKNNGENYYADRFRAMENLTHGSRWNVAEEREEVVWSSKQKPEPTA